MTEDFVIGFTRQAIETALSVSLPMLGVGLIVGVVVSILQAATQIQEQTLVFIPKIVSIFLALLIAFPFVLETLSDFTAGVITNIPNYIR